jgi:hypothetical protein
MLALSLKEDSLSVPYKDSLGIDTLANYFNEEVVLRIAVLIV